jgi:hypothetical protein
MSPAKDVKHVRVVILFIILGLGVHSADFQSANFIELFQITDLLLLGGIGRDVILKQLAFNSSRMDIMRIVQSVSDKETRCWPPKR